MDLGERIRELRGNTSVAEFCRIFNIHRNTLPRYESGERTPDADFIVSICNNYKINANWLLLDKGTKFQEEEQKQPQGQLDEKLLTDAVVTLEKALQATGRVMPPEAKAELIIKIYELFSEEGQGASKDNLFKILRLVA